MLSANEARSKEKKSGKDISRKNGISNSSKNNGGMYLGFESRMEGKVNVAAVCTSVG